MWDDEAPRPVMHGDEFALLLAVSPLALQMAGRPGAGPLSLLLIPGLAAFQLLCVLGDGVRLGALGHPRNRVATSPAWSLLPGAYLRRRARALRRSDDLFWTWIIAMIVSIGVLVLSAALHPRVPAGARPSSHGIPAIEEGGSTPGQPARHAGAGR